MRKPFPTLLLLGKPKKFKLSAMKNMLLYQTAEETPVQLTTALQIRKLLEKAFNTDHRHFPS